MRAVRSPGRRPGISEARSTREERLRLSSALLLLALSIAGCSRPAGPATAAAAAEPPRPASVAYRDIADLVGITFRQTNGATGEHRFVETTCGGCAFLDYDNDGFQDLFLVQSGPVPGDPLPPGGRPPCALYRNEGDGRFRDVTAGVGLDADLGYANGVTVGDYDNDGWDDLYVTAYGGNRLLRNRQGRRFDDVTARAGVADNERGPRFSTSAAWADFDGDGHLDLIVLHYMPWTPRTDKVCVNMLGARTYCTPDLYPGERLTLYRGGPDGRFRDVTLPAGLGELTGRSLGVTWLDYDQDGRQDAFIANDLMPNFLLRNEGRGRFRNRAFEAGVATDESGVVLAGMGIAVGDYDNDGYDDLVVTNFSNQPKSVYRNQGDGGFLNATFASGIGGTTQRVLGWGLDFLDFDHDGWKDLVVGNGHVNDDIETYSRDLFYREPKQLFRNRGRGLFEEEGSAAGDLAQPRVTRGLAVGDVDNDGTLEILTNNHNDRPELFRREPGQGSWVTLRLQGNGTSVNRAAIGARVWCRSPGLTQYAQVRSASSYASSGDRRLNFGLGAARKAESVTIAWPDGSRETVRDLAAGRFYLIEQGRGARPDPRVRPWNLRSKP